MVDHNIKVQLRKDKVTISPGFSKRWKTIQRLPQIQERGPYRYRSKHECCNTAYNDNCNLDDLKTSEAVPSPFWAHSAQCTGPSHAWSTLKYLLTFVFLLHYSEIYDITIHCFVIFETKTWQYSFKCSWES